MERRCGDVSKLRDLQFLMEMTGGALDSFRAMLRRCQTKNMILKDVVLEMYWQIGGVLFTSQPLADSVSMIRRVDLWQIISFAIQRW